MHVTPNMQNTSSEHPVAIPAVSNPVRPLLGFFGPSVETLIVGFVEVADAVSLEVS